MYNNNGESNRGNKRSNEIDWERVKQDRGRAIVTEYFVYCAANPKDNMLINDFVCPEDDDIICREYCMGKARNKGCNKLPFCQAFVEETEFETRYPQINFENPYDKKNNPELIKELLLIKRGFIIPK